MANASEILESLSRSFTKTADKVAKKTDEFIAVQKVKNRKNTLENQVNSTYRTIGKIVHKEYMSGDMVSEEIAELCEKIEALQKEIEACTGEIADIKGVQICDSCGNPIPDEAEYCMKCGARKEEKEPEDAEFMAVDPEEDAVDDAEDEEEEDNDGE